MSNILILNGPNLNMLGVREPEIYGHETLSDIERQCREMADSLGLELEFEQTNSEEEIVTAIQQAPESYAGVILNAAAYTHTSVAIGDAIKMIDVPVIEVHISNVYQRESFRHTSYVSPVAAGIIVGFGGQGYRLALQAITEMV